MENRTKNTMKIHSKTVEMGIGTSNLSQNSGKQTSIAQNRSLETGSWNLEAESWSLEVRKWSLDVRKRSPEGQDPGSSSRAPAALD